MKLSETGWLAILCVGIIATGAYASDRDAARKHELQMAQLKCPVTDTTTTR
jgi:hypothetical protein